MTEELKKCKNSGKRLLLTFNEWTGKNRRYITFNVHTTNTDFTNLGMVRASSSQKAETILELVTKRIKDYGLAMDDIIAFVSRHSWGLHHD